MTCKLAAQFPCRMRIQPAVVLQLAGGAGTSRDTCWMSKCAGFCACLPACLPSDSFVVHVCLLLQPMLCWQLSASLVLCTILFFCIFCFIHRFFFNTLNLFRVALYSGC